MDECTCWAPDDAEPEDHDLDCPLSPLAAADAGYEEFDDDEEDAAMPGFPPIRDIPPSLVPTVVAHPRAIASPDPKSED